MSWSAQAYVDSERIHLYLAEEVKETPVFFPDLFKILTNSILQKYQMAIQPPKKAENIHWSLYSLEFLMT